jgi:filamentous hemagglutinin family protein
MMINIIAKKMVKKYVVLVALVIFNPATQAEVVTDGSLGAKTNLPGPDFVIESQLGQAVGTNLFHSFETFNLQANESAIFRGATHIERVISRVTGGQASVFNGKLISEIPEADFYFINPAGILLGKNASLDISGSLYLSTADYLTLGEGGYFAIEGQESSILTTAPPIAFGFLDHPIGKMTIDGSLLATPTLEVVEQNLKAGMPVPAKTLGLVGGDMEINNAALSASGKIHLTSVAAPGEVPIDTRSLPQSLPAEFGKITITHFLTNEEKIEQTVERSGNLMTTGAGGGEIFIRAGQLILDYGYLFADTFGQEDGQGIRLDITEKLVLKNAARITSDVFQHQDFPIISMSNAGHIDITSQIIEITGGSQISSINNTAIGKAGNITLLAQIYLAIEGYVTSETNAGKQSISSAILSGSGGFGPGGNIYIKTPELVLDNLGEIRSETLGFNHAGHILAEVGQLTLLGGAQINASTGRVGLTLQQVAGQGGNITISAPNGIIIDGQGSFFNDNQLVTRSSGLLSNTFNQGIGGLISLTTSSLTMKNHGQIQSATGYEGNGGQLNITATQLLMDHASFTTHSGGNGFAGHISLQSQQANLTDSQITTNSFFSGGGNIEINILNQLHLINSQISARAQGEQTIHQGGNLTFGEDLSPQIITLNNSQLLANAYAGNGGNIKVIANNLVLSSDSVLNASSELGIDGEIKIEATSRIFDEVEMLPAVFAQNLLVNSCDPLTSALRLRQESTFSIFGRIGLSIKPEEMQF